MADRITAPKAAGRRKGPAKPAPTGADRIPKPSAGWYRDPETGAKLRRVTTILDQGFAKGDVLTIWSGNITAETAMEHLPQLVAASMDPVQRADITKWLKLTHIRKRDERRDVGLAVHQIIQAHVLGEPVPGELLEDPALKPFLRHFMRFVTEWQVTFEASEMTVASYERGYAGTLDFLLRSSVIAELLGYPLDALFLGDTKTGGELDVKGVYPEAGFQMAAYRHAGVGWLSDGTKVPMAATQKTGIVLHLRPEGYRVIPVTCDETVFEAFLEVQRQAEFHRTAGKKVVGKALTLPVTEDTTEETHVKAAA